jgi:hypothetical protein
VVIAMSSAGRQEEKLAALVSVGTWKADVGDRPLPEVASSRFLVADAFRFSHTLDGPERQQRSAHSSYDNLKTNADGSIDLYFGPEAPAGWESNWLETVPGKGFYPMFRFYSAKEGLFDGTWALPDIDWMK